ncbi:MAG: Membrane protein [Burkholderiaceae bacterium]|jgi:drug/metabolite transporter (DMT)-like permease|nr:MAG: Membrane protein [Burkholderiaceae bacterium]
MKLTRARAVLLMVLVTLMWSVAGVVTRQLEHARSFEVTFWRSFFTMLSLLVILPAWKGPGVFRAMHWRSPSFWISGVCWCVMFTAYMVALTLTTVGNVLVTMSIAPLLTALFARAFIGHRITARTWVAIALAGAGIGYMFGSQMNVAAGGQQALLGMLVALGVPVAGAANWTVVQRSQAHGEQLDLIPSVLVGAVLSSVVTLPLSVPFAASSTDLRWLSFLGVVQLAIPCVLSVVSAKVLKAPEVALLALLEVIFGILWAWAGADEVPANEVLIGGTLVIAALAGNELLGWQRRARLAPLSQAAARPPIE